MEETSNSGNMEMGSVKTEGSTVASGDNDSQESKEASLDSAISEVVAPTQSSSAASTSSVHKQPRSKKSKCCQSYVMDVSLYIQNHTHE